MIHEEIHHLTSPELHRAIRLKAAKVHFALNEFYFEKNPQAKQISMRYFLSKSQMKPSPTSSIKASHVCMRVCVCVCVCVTLHCKKMMCVFCTSSRSVISERSLGLWCPHPQIPQLNLIQGSAVRRGEGRERSVKEQSRAEESTKDEKESLSRAEQNTERGR